MPNGPFGHQIFDNLTASSTINQGLVCLLVIPKPRSSTMSLALTHALPNDPMIRLDLISGASSGPAEAAERIRSVNKWRA